MGALTAFVFPGGRAGPTFLLACLLPLALALSRSLRRTPLLPFWALVIVPSVVVLGALSSETDLALTPLGWVLAVVGAVAFAYRGRGEARIAVPLAVLGVAAMLVAYFSSGRGGPEPMEHWYERFGLGKALADGLTIAFRKTVHFTFYGTIGLATLIAARRAGADRNEALRTAFLAAFAVASCDELRQSAYANRTGTPWDVLLDLSGAAVFVGLSEWRRAKAR